MPEISGVPPELILAKLQQSNVQVGYLTFRNFLICSVKFLWSVEEKICSVQVNILICSLKMSVPFKKIF